MEEKKSDQASTSLETAPAEATTTPATDSAGKSQQGAGSSTTPGSDKDADVQVADGATPAADTKSPKKSGFKKWLRTIDVYLLAFVLLIVLVAGYAIVNYLNSKKTPNTPNAVNQNLTTDQLKQLANSNASVGNTGQTVTIQGNAIFSGQVLVQRDLDVAGSIKLGGQLLAQNFTASGTVSLANTQIQSLQVANDTVLQGDVTTQHNLNVGGTSTFSGAITATQLTVTNLTLSGNATLQVPNHVAFTGPSPSRTAISTGALGAGGSVSVNGSDMTGTINVNTGANPQPGCFISIAFNKPFSATPHVMVSPVDQGAGEVQYYTTRSTTSMSLCSANSAPANQVFAFDYFITD